MALVRCPKHKIPYNDENPRGCPACAREKSGSGQSLMQELARAQQQPSKRRVAAPAPAETKPRGTRTTGGTLRAAAPHPLAVTTPPRQPTAVEGPLGRLWRKATDRRLVAGGGALILIMIAVLLVGSGPRFAPGINPAVVADADARPLPLDPNTPIAMAFSALGTKPPQQNPDDSRLFRYTYGSDLMVDAVSGYIYAITLRVANRSWRGLRVGMNEQRARGELALLGPPVERTVATQRQAQVVGGYVVYSSLQDRPLRRLQTEVRPPNGCFDVVVDLQPQAIGAVSTGGQRYVAVAREGGSPVWVVTQIRVVSRSRSGPYAGSPAC